MAETHRFCPQCGQNLFAPTPAAAPRPARDHQRHVKLLAVLLAVWGGLGLLGALGLMLAAGAVANLVANLAGHILPVSLLTSLLASLAWVFIGLSVAAMAAGAGLLDYEPWARPLAVVVCVLALLRFPVGTALGIYGLWVLVSAAGQHHFRQVARGRS